MKPVIVIEELGEVEALVKQLARERYVAVDTESNSFYAYFERICLLQISTEQEDYIIDPFAVKDLSPLGEIFEDPRIQKIFHAASNDVLGLKRDYRFRFNNVFDTAVSCKLLGYNRLGLAQIIEKHFGVALNKKKWQRYDWGRRPLGREQLDYARLDTHFLIPLRHRLSEGLEELNLLIAAKEASEKACLQEAQEKCFQPDAFIQIRGARTLDDTGKRILKALYIYRDHEARRRNRAPFRVISNEALLRLAQHRPCDLNSFVAIKGLPRSYESSRDASRLLKLIRNFAESEDGAMPPQ
jgi:ribonuclease D